MKAVFLSDAHLKRSTDEPYVLLLRFLAELAEGRVGPAAAGKEAAGAGAVVDDLYILGDFFDFWFCRPDRIYPEFQPVIRQLVELRQSGVRIHLFEGNHDFFMREYFYDVLGMDVVEESASIDLDSNRVFVAHGDTLDRTNVFYLTLRKVLRSRTFYHLQRLIPSPFCGRRPASAPRPAKRSRSKTERFWWKKCMPAPPKSSLQIMMR